MTVTNIALPNLIAYDIALTQPLSSFSGNIAYLEFIAGSNKGAVSQGDLFNNPFQLGDAHPDYTSDRVVEQFTATADQTEFTVAWTPVSDRKDDAGKFADVKVLVNGTAVEVKGVDSKTGKITVDQVTDQAEVRIAYVYNNVVIPQNDLPILSARMRNIPVATKTRRIAIYYSQIANFQA